jgi:hypothetical protein
VYNVLKELNYLSYFVSLSIFLSRLNFVFLFRSREAVEHNGPGRVRPRVQPWLVRAGGQPADPHGPPGAAGACSWRRRLAHCRFLPRHGLQPIRLLKGSVPMIMCIPLRHILALVPK